MTRQEIYLFVMENVGYNTKAKEWLIDHYLNASKKHNQYHMD